MPAHVVDRQRPAICRRPPAGRAPRRTGIRVKKSIASSTVSMKHAGSGSIASVIVTPVRSRMRHEFSRVAEHAGRHRRRRRRGRRSPSRKAPGTVLTLPSMIGAIGQQHRQQPRQPVGVVRRASSRQSGRYTCSFTRCAVKSAVRKAVDRQDVVVAVAKEVAERVELRRLFERLRGLGRQPQSDAEWPVMPEQRADSRKRRSQDGADLVPRFARMNVGAVREVESSADHHRRPKTTVDWTRGSIFRPRSRLGPRARRCACATVASSISVTSKPWPMSRSRVTCSSPPRCSRNSRRPWTTRQAAARGRAPRARRPTAGTRSPRAGAGCARRRSGAGSPSYRIDHVERQADRDRLAVTQAMLRSSIRACAPPSDRNRAAARCPARTDRRCRRCARGAVRRTGG